MLFSDAQAQPGRILQGEIRSAADGQVLEGVSIYTETGREKTLTDKQGKFNLRVVADTGTLHIRYVGYAAQRLAYNKETTVLEISLNTEENRIEEVEVVSTGYQNLPKERATGSFVKPVQTIFENRVSTDVLGRLNGITNGLIFNANSGNTINGRLDINIRGRNTINADDQPLIIVDNFPYQGDVGDINPNDVESVTVMKDAAAASIWGARAGNGVIVITTKTGKIGTKTNIRLNANTTIAGRPDLSYDPFYLSAKDYIYIEKFLYDRGKYNNDLNNTVSFPVVSPAVEIMADASLSSHDSLLRIQNLAGLDVRHSNSKYFFQPSVKQQYTVSFSGGTDRSSFYLSAGYDKNDAEKKYNSNQRLSLSSVLTHRLKDWVSITTGVYLTHTTEQIDRTFNSIYSRAESYFPYIQYTDLSNEAIAIDYMYRRSYVDGIEEKGFQNWNFVPLDELGSTSNIIDNLNVRITPGVEFDLGKGIRIEGKLQYQQLRGGERILHPDFAFSARDLVNRFASIDANGVVNGYNVPKGGYLEKSSFLQKSLNIRGQLNYDRSYGVHHVNAIAGYEVSEALNDSDYLMLFGYNDDLATHTPVNSIGYFPTNPSGNSAIPANASVGGTVDRFRSTYGLASYSLDNRYIITGSGRVDGSNYLE
jgi:TonB-dependent SusC/RagA subfamily outer membrane receptor